MGSNANLGNQSTLRAISCKFFPSCIAVLLCLTIVFDVAIGQLRVRGFLN